MRDLRDRVVVIAGASSGIGEAAAYAFARRGSHVVLAARRSEPLARIETDIRAVGVQTLVVPTDVTDPVQVDRLNDACLDRFGRIDVLVNSVGAGLVGSFVETPFEQVERLVEVNLLGVARLTHVVLRTMERQEAGVVINVASTAGLLPVAYVPAYGATKAALVSLSESVNLEYVGTGIKVVAFCPHVTATDFAAEAKCYGRFRRPTIFGRPVSRAHATEKLLRLLSLTPVNPFRPVPAEWVAEKLVAAALKPKPLIALGGFVHRGLLAKALMPPWFYQVARLSRRLMECENPPDGE